MAFYGKLTLVEEFFHRDHTAKIYRAMRGATHCRIDHELKERRCLKCGKPVEPKRVFLVYVEDQALGIDCETKEDAVELAHLWIDDMIDDPDDEEDDLVEIENGPKKPPKERDAKSPPGDAGVKKKLTKQMKQLGWGRRARAMVAKDAEKSA